MSKAKILIVEDDVSLREALSDTLELAGYQIEAVENGEAAIAKLNDIIPDIILSDVQMPKIDGIALLAHVRKYYSQIPMLLITAHASIDKAVNAMQLGAVDYLSKPFESKVLVEKVKQFLVPTPKDETAPVAEDPNSLQLLAIAKRVATSDATVLITGESGTGKEVLSRYIHDQSPRAHQPFVAINCAAIPDNMLEATLFGYEKGAFTGAHQSCPGKFEQANGGTLLLDEISEMSLALQAKLLRVLQEREVERLGGRKIIKLDVRVLATSNRQLIEEVADNRFREDLFYRLNVFPLHWIPLRERIQDIVPLAEYLLDKNSVNRVIPKLTAAAKDKLIQHDWPGNAREMGNVIQRALILQQAEEITEQDIQFEINSISSIDVQPLENTTTMSAEQKEGLGTDLKRHEHDLIMRTLQKVNGKRSEVAKILGISPRTLRYKLAKMREQGFAV